MPADRLHTVGLQQEGMLRLAQANHRLIGRRIEQLNGRTSLYGCVRLIGDLCAEGHLVSFTHEARQVWRHHQWLTADDLLREQLLLQRFRMAEQLELPRCMAVRQGKINPQITEGVGLQRRIEESRLCKVCS